MKRKLSVLVVTLLMCLSSVLIISDELKVKASGGGEGGDGGIGLDYDFVWSVTEDLCNVVYDADYENPDIRKGRAWATEGENYTIERILKPKMLDEDYCNLSDVTKLPIGYLSDFPEKNYSSKIVVNDFELSISHLNETYPYQTPVPYNETFPVPNGWDCWKCGKVTHNYTFDNIRVLSLDRLRQIWGENWPFDGTLTNYFLKVSYQNLNDHGMIIGNVSYIASGENLPDDQDGMVFLIDEEEGCEDILANVTHAVGCILLYNDSREYKYENAIDCYFSVARANVSDNEGNLTNIIDMLENGEIIIVDNAVTPEILTFTYNLTEQTCYPIFDFFLLKKIHAPSELQGLAKFWKDLFGCPQWNDWGIAVGIGILLHPLNCKPLIPNCYGFILYDHINTHFMGPNSRDWWENDVPALPMFSVNYSVGNWISENTSVGHRVRVSGYLDQTYKQQNSTTPGVKTYNTVGYRNISQSPNDEIVVISNRIDGWWGETPGDSGVGCALVLGIAKYFNDYNITPKYNLTFLFTTGEEYGFRGAKHFVDSHPENEYNYTLFIGTDQLAFNQIGTNLSINCNNATYAKIVYAIANETNYIERIGSKYGLEVSAVAGGRSEDAVWNKTCKTIGFGKDNTSLWDRYHRAGMNYEEGDTLKYTDRDDVNLTFEILWNVTKYFTVDPDCWFSNVTYEAFDSPNDGDTLDDSIRATFEINTIMPHDKVRVWADIIQYVDDTGGTINYTRYNDYTITYPGVEKTWIFPIPDLINHGECSVQLKLMNSTGRIDYIATLGGTANYDDTTARSDYYHLYHPFGYPIKGSEFVWAFDRIVGSTFTVNENAYADNITAYVYQDTGVPVDSSKCMIYRKNDSSLIGITEELTFGMAMGGDWITYDFEEEKPSLVKDIEYVLVVWGEDTHVYYDDFTFSRGRFNETTYGGSAPDPINFTNESRLYSIYCSYTIIDTTPPEITNVSATPSTVGFGFNVTISADVTDDLSGVDTVNVTIDYPSKDSMEKEEEHTMNISEGSTYEYVFTDTWKVGQYNYTIWAVDKANNSNSSSGHSFNISAQATISVCTIKDEYGDNEIINVTDPPLIGYELLDDDKVLHIWNRYNSYYFNTSSGIQLTNHYNKYWSHNVLMLGYYNNDEWNLIYRADELSGFNKDIDSDNENYVNATLWKDLTYSGYSFRLAIRYHLGVDDRDLTVIPYIKNLGQAIPYVLGFAWEINDINIADTYENDWIHLYNGTDWMCYLLNQPLDNRYTDMGKNTTFVLEGHNEGMYFRRTLYLRWDDSLNYLLQVKSRDGEYNAPVTLFIKVGMLGENQEKSTELQWLDSDDWLGISSSELDSFCGEEGEEGYTLAGALDGDNAWIHKANEEHWFILDLGQTYTVKKVRGRSNMPEMNPMAVDIYVSDNKENWGDYVERIDGEWSNTEEWVEIDTADKAGRYVKVQILSTENPENHIGFGDRLPFTIFDVYGEIIGELYERYNTGDVDLIDISGEQWIGQTFTVGDTGANEDHDIMSVKLKLARYGLPGTVTVSIRETDKSGIPTGEDLTYGTTDGDTLTDDENGEWRGITLTPYMLSKSTKYAIVVRALESGPENCLLWRLDHSDPTYTGGSLVSGDSGSYWEIDTNIDLMFEEYGDSGISESKIKNTGSTDIRGYLLMQVHFFDEMLEEWVVADDTVNETSPRPISLFVEQNGSGGQLGLDTIFNGLVNTNDLSEYGSGTYRVYAAFRDPNENILKCDDETELEAWCEFDINFD